MTRMILVAVLLAACLVALPATAARAELTLDLESGIVGSGYNDVRIPGETGTLFSLSEDLSTPSRAFFRARLSYAFGGRHALSALYAPLTLEADGTLESPVIFEGEEFPAGTDVEGTYTFNSYRLTYRYTLTQRERFEAGVGFTAKIRDALVRVDGGGLSSEKTDLGFVPLLNFRLEWGLSEQLGLLLEGDALVGPQGRAEDVIAAVLYDVNDRVRFRVGYRIVEGGADVDEVYNFTLLNYASAGLAVTF